MKKNTEYIYLKLDFKENWENDYLSIQSFNTNLEICLRNNLFFRKNFDEHNKLIHYKEKNKKSFIVHLPFIDLQIASQDDYIKAYSMNLLYKAIDFSKAIAADKLVMHTGLSPTIPKAGLFKWQKSFFNSLESLLVKVESNNQLLLLENTWERDTTFFENIFKIFPSPKLMMCLDIAHIYCFSDQHFSEWINRLYCKISHLHLSNNSYDEDSHLPLNKGKINYKEILKKFSAKLITITLENKINDHPLSLNYLAETS